jgi:hypothetical protein
LVLITPEKKGYLLEKKDPFQEAFDRLKEFVNKEVEVTLSGFHTGRIKGFRYLDHITKEAKQEEFEILPVALINKTEKASRNYNLDISKSIEYEPAAKEVFTGLRKIKGRISKVDFKSVIPTLELEGKENFVLLLTSDTQVLKVSGDELVSYRPKDMLKTGNNVEIWYEEKGYQNNARMIVIMDKD